MHFTPLVIAALAAVVVAKTDLTGCTTSNTVDAYGEASVLYYVPGSCEICAFLDCGGGRAPPKTTVPGCPAYSGTASYSPSFLATCGGATGSASLTSSGPMATSTNTSSSTGIVTQPGPVVVSPSMTASSMTSVSNGSTSATITSAPASSSGDASVVITSTLSSGNGTSGNGGSGSGSGSSSGSSSSVAGPQSGASVMGVAKGLMAIVAAGAAYFL